MFIARLVIGGLLFALFVAGARFNALCMLRFRREGPHEPDAQHPPMLVFLPGIAGAAACLVTPYALIRHFAWLPLLLDPGCIPAVGFAIWLNADYFRGTSCLVRRTVYRDENAERMITLELFSSGWYRLQWRRMTRVTPADLPAMASASTAEHWHMKNGQVHLQFSDGTAILQASGSRLEWQTKAGPSWLDNQGFQLVKGPPLSAYKRGDG